MECADFASVLLYKAESKEIKIIAFHTDFLLPSKSVTHLENEDLSKFLKLTESLVYKDTMSK